MWDIFTNNLIDNGIIKKDEKAIYEYGLKLLLMYIINIATTIFIGLLMGMVLESIIFVISYGLLRPYAGGAHAKTQLRCYGYSCLLVLFTLLIIMFLPESNIILGVIVVVSSILIVVLAPVEDNNKPLDEVEVKVYKRRTRLVLLTETAVIILMLVLNLYYIAIAIAVSVGMVAIMLVAGKSKNTIIAKKLLLK